MEFAADNRKITIAWKVARACLQYTGRVLVALYAIVSAIVFFSIYTAPADVPMAALTGLIQSSAFWNMSVLLASVIASGWWLVRPPQEAVVKRGGSGGDQGRAAGGLNSRPF